MKPAAVALAGLAAGAGCGPGRPAPPLRNLVVVVVDTLRQDHLSAYGYERETAPAITRLAREGVRADGVSPTSWTKPAVASLLTGLHPLRHQAVGHGDALPRSARTLAERLGELGYRSLGITANGWLSRDAGFAQGFEAYHSMFQDLGRGQFSTARELNAELLPRLASLAPPFLLYVHYLDPHAPYDPDRGWNGLPLPPRLARRKGGVGIPELRMEVFERRPPDLVRDALDLYDGEIRAADDAIDELMAELGRLRLGSGTLTVVTSDHGEEFEEHGRMGHGHALYEESLRVPLVFHAPSVLPAGARIGTASLLDVVPTVLELLGRPLPAGECDGTSLARALRDAQPGAPVARSGSAERELLLHLDLAAAGQSLALRGERLKLVLAKGPHRSELYDLAVDAREQRNLLREEAGRAAFEALAVRLAEVHNATSARALAADGEGERPETTEAMAALGYVGAGGGAGAWRRIPPRIRPAEARPGSLVGWEDLERLPVCLEPGRPEGLWQLLDGWGEAEGGGRWLADRALAVVRNPAGDAGRVLRLQGDNRTPRPARLAVFQGDRVVGRAELPPGSFASAAVLDGASSGPVTFEIRIGAGAAGGRALLVSRACVAAESAARAASFRPPDPSAAR